MDAARELYEDDFFAWTRHQAWELRRLRGLHLNTALDLDHLYEEVRGLGDEKRDACRSHAERIIEHLLKLRYSPAAWPRAGRKRSVAGAGSALDRKLSARLRKDLERQLSRLYVDARRMAVLGLEEYDEAEAARLLPETCPFTLDDILRQDWYPERVLRPA